MTEDDLEQSCLGWFESIGWESTHGEILSPGGAHPEREHYTDVVLAERLRGALARMNPQLGGDARETAAQRVLQFTGQALPEANRDLYEWLRDGIPVEIEDDGHQRIVRAQVFDWDEPGNNDWLVVNQFAVKGSKLRRPDIVAFVNGLPLAVIELKNPADLHADVTSAYNQIQTYKDEIPQLFEPNVANVISDGAVARVGSLTADESWHVPWRVAEGIDNPDQHLELEILVRGLFEHTTFLTFMRYMVAFETTGAGTAKMIAGYHQHFGVLKAVDRAVEAITHRQDGRGGVMWFTQGSGKSLLALFYVGMLRERSALENPTVVVVTDRNDLDGQLYETFANCQIPLRTTPHQAADRAELRRMLAEQPAGGVFFTTIQKFAPDEPGQHLGALTERRNVIVICDEAHRSQYGFKARFDRTTGRKHYGLAQHMREALPNAVYLGLTGTPISAEDKDTEAVFGDYVDIYDVYAAQEDGTTVPIHYESRIIDLVLNEDERDLLDTDFEALLEDEDAQASNRAITRLTRLESVAMAEGRLTTLAEDLVAHWERRLATLDGKGMIVAISRKAAVALYDAITALRPDWHSDELESGAIKVVMTSTASDPPEMQAHSTSRQEKKLLERRLKDPDDPLKLVIVRDMWLTGFDAKPLHTLYVDKPMKGHNLMQAVARVNRVWRDKPGGLVVDYIGLGEELKKAIRDYTREQGDQRGRPVEFVEQAVGQLQDSIDAIRALFHGLDLSGYAESPERALTLLPQAMDHILTVDPGDADNENRGLKRFLDLVTRVTKAQALAGTHADALALRDEIAFYQAVRAGLVKHTRSGKQLTPTEREAAMHQIVAKGVLVEGVTDLYQTLGVEQPDISVLDEHFLRQVAKQPKQNLAAELLQRLIDDEIQSRSRKNTTQAHKFSEKLDEAINKYRNRGLTTAEVIEELIRLAREIAEDRPPDDMGEDEYAFYQALVQNESAVRELGDPSLRALAHELTGKLRQSASIDWQKRNSAQAKMRTMVRLLLKRYKYPPDAEEAAIQRVMTQAENYADEWNVSA
ncbi:type I restriction endonuclease subunit R [Salinisphaera orenii]|uniref:type I restriction endonuclease subunit R n=1 Tax=Salinisphaera orenii TaxID=856731 RepID=UPI000DBE1EA4